MFTYEREREKQKIRENALMQETSLHTLLDSESKWSGERKKQKVIMDPPEETEWETTYCMCHFISVSYKLKRQKNSIIEHALIIS